MIQTLLDIGILCLKGDKPIFEFDDIHHLEATISQLQRLAEKWRSQKKERLEFFSDGVYLDGKRIELKGYQQAFLRLYENNDSVHTQTLSEKVWGDSLVSQNKIKCTIQHIYANTGITFHKKGEYYTIDRPK